MSTRSHLSRLPSLSAPRRMPGRQGMRRLASCLLLLSVLSACAEQPAAASKEEPPPPRAGFIRVVPQDVPLTTRLPGRTVAALRSEVRPQVGGILLSREVKEGAQVKKGDVLFEIDPAVYRAAVGQAQAALASAKASINSSRLRAERYGELLADEAVSQQEADDATATYQEAQAAVAQAQAALTSARLNLSYTKVRAPISGRVGLTQVTPGALVSANQEQPLTTIRNLDPIYVDFVQSSADMLRMRTRLAAQGKAPSEATVHLVLEDGSRYPQAGRLLSREVAVDEATGAVTLRAEFANADEVLLPGMYVRVEMTQGIAKQAVMAPQRAVARDPRAEPVAWVLDADDKAQQRSLKVAQTVGTCWLVTSGLKDGDRLVVEGTQSLSPGVQVTPVERPELASCDLEETAEGAESAPKSSPGDSKSDAANKADRGEGQ